MTTTGASLSKANTATLRYTGDNPKYKGMEITVSLEDIISSRAKSDLDNQRKDQRSVRWSHVERLKCDIETGNFVFTGEPAIYDTKGRGADQQHRWLAIADAVITAPEQIPVVLTVRGVPEEAMSAMGNAAARNASDHILVAGYDDKLAKIMPAAFKYLVFYALGKQDVMGNRERFMAMEEDINKLLAASKFASTFTKSQTAFLKPGVVAATVYLGILSGNRTETESFFTQLREGFGFGDKSTPAYATYRHLNSKDGELSLQKEADRYEIFKRILHGLSAHLESKNMLRVQLGKTESGDLACPVIVKAEPDKVARRFNLV